MIKKDLVSRVTAFLRENNIRKPVSIPKQVFHISDDEGNSRNFSVKKIDKEVLYTVEDVQTIVDACQYIMQEAIKAGEEISIHGFGKIFLKYMKPKAVRNVLDNEPVEVPGHYSPKFTAGNDLRRCAQFYEQSLKDINVNQPLPIFSELDN